eukprot:2846991-Alexandrium_andersonii.AAC.1
MEVAEKAKRVLQWHSDEYAAGRRRKTKPWRWGHLDDGFFGARCQNIAEAPSSSRRTSSASGATP